MAVLYIANKNYSSWSLRPWLLVQELNLPIEESVIPFHGAGGAPSFSQLSPTHKLPCLHDGELQVWDSLAITEYLAERHPSVWPADPRARAWARSACAEMHAGFVMLRSICAMNVGVRVALREMPLSLQADLKRIDALWQEGLQRFGGPFLAGERFTAVDAFFAPVCFRLQTYGLRLSPSAMTWVQTLLARPSLQAWYRDALDEPWVDHAHERDIDAVGELVEDLRSVHRLTVGTPL